MLPSIPEQAGAYVRGSAMMQDKLPGRPINVAQAAQWRTEPDGAITAEAGALRLVVHPLTPGGYVHFLVLRRPGDDGAHAAMLASGSEADLSAAMRSAERAVARLADAGSSRTPPHRYAS